MALEVGKFYVDEVVLGADTRLDGRTLVVSRDAVRALALREAAVADLRIDVAAPGDATRIIHVLDAVPATVKVKGPGGVFPGFLAEPVPSGRGRLHRVENLAVLTCAELPWGGGGLFVAREAVIDMSGPAQALSPFGAMFNVVLNVRLAPDALPTDQEAVVRRVGLGVAAHVGRALADAVPVDVVAHGRPELPDLPRIVYIHQVHSQGLYARTFLYGQDLDTLLPTPLDPNGLLEGALVSGCYLYAAYKTPTWLHCRNPVVEQLCAGHGRDHVFAGMVLSRGFHYTTLEKQRSASYAAHVAHLLRADGVVLTWDGSGNSATDAMLTLQACERLGIKGLHRPIAAGQRARGGCAGQHGQQRARHAPAAHVARHRGRQPAPASGAGGRARAGRRTAGAGNAGRGVLRRGSDRLRPAGWSGVLRRQVVELQGKTAIITVQFPPGPAAQPDGPRRCGGVVDEVRA
jgi:glycine reductase